MTLRISLRWKILLLALFTPATLAVATLLTVSRNVSRHVDSSSIHESLAHSVSVFESVLDTRSRELAGGARVIARDPRFFSLVMLGRSQHDSRFAATVRGMARDFNQIARTDLFEVLDRNGRVLASVGAASASSESRAPFLPQVLRGRPVEGILAEKDAHYQVALVPVLADRRVVGVLLLGREIGPSLAQELKAMMKCEVTFFAGTTFTGTTLEAPGDRTALVRALERLPAEAYRDLARHSVQRVEAPHNSYLTVVRHLPGSDPAMRQLFVMQRSFDPETSFQSLMRRDLLVLAAIALAAAIITSLQFSERLLRPVHRLVRGAQEMEKGNYDYSIGNASHDELGYLATRFSEMRRRERAYLGSLEQAARLKSRFLSIASHELRTPISVLIGYHDLFVHGALGPVTDPQKQALDTMRTHLDRLTRLADDAASFARVKGERLVLDLQLHEVPALLGNAVTAARAAGAGRSVRIEVTCEPIDTPVEADAGSLEQAIFQLVTNGIRFTADGGQVDVSARARGGRLVIEVRDSGVGIEPERLEALLADGFAPADALKHRSSGGLDFNLPGLGLGLSIVSAIVEAHGGLLRAESTPGEGSTFAIELPMRQSHAAKAA
jgi:signal transduction histidine kinase